VPDYAVPVLPSRDLRETLAFWERLGFHNAGAPPEQWDYMIIRRNGAELHYYLDPKVDPRTTDFTCYVFTSDADSLYEEWEAVGVRSEPETGSRLHAITDMDYGMRQFAVIDPSGVQVSFGSPVAAPAGSSEAPDA
jgi:catechol 2,3-dioxygenase-like lactoylglutathione lyase family enzyme